MWICKKHWREMEKKNSENEFRITRLELKVARLESLLEEKIKGSESELEGFIDSLLSGDRQ